MGAERCGGTHGCFKFIAGRLWSGEHRQESRHGVSIKLTIQTPAVWLCVFKSQIILQSNNYTIFICYEKAMSINNNLKELDFAS